MFRADQLTMKGAHMKFRLQVGTIVFALASTICATAVAAPDTSAPPPSVFETGMNGFGMGLTAGLAGGYLVARSDGFTSRDWRPLVAGAGIGALAGGVLGLSLAIYDNNSAVRGRGFLVMRGMGKGGVFGAVAGGIIGGLAALGTDNPEHILFGAAIGTLAGSALGLVVGTFERNPWASQNQSRVGWNVGVAPYGGAGGARLAWGPVLSGRF
jgi:hypothetical protein